MVLRAFRVLMVRMVKMVLRVFRVLMVRMVKMVLRVFRVLMALLVLRVRRVKPEIHGQPQGSAQSVELMEQSPCWIFIP